MKGHINVHKSVGGISRVAIAVCIAVLVAVFVTAYGVGTSTANPRKARLMEANQRSLTNVKANLESCERFKTTYQKGDKVTVAQAIAELERQHAEATEGLKLEEERVAMLRPVLQRCKDEVAELRKRAYGAPEANITAHLADLNKRREALLEQHDVLTNVKEVRRRSDLLTLQSAIVQQLVNIDRDKKAGARVSVCEASTTKYSVVFDIGSSGNRVHVYKYTVKAVPTTARAKADVAKPARDLMSEIDLTEELFELNQKALSKLPNPVAEAPAALRELFDKAKAFVPAELHYCTPVEFKATAGLRMLGTEKATAILSEIRRAYRNETFWMRGGGAVRILDGSEEGPMAWLTVNFLLGAFNQNSGNATVAVIDLGGGSTQVVFEPHDADAFRAVPGPQQFTAKLGSRPVRAYQHSYEGFGLHSATRELLFHIQGKCQEKAATTTTGTDADGKGNGGGVGGILDNLFGAGKNNKDADDDEDDRRGEEAVKADPEMDLVAMEAFPCFAVNYTDALGVSNTKMTTAANNVSVPVTQPNFTACVNLFRDRLLKPVDAPCTAAHCGIRNVFQPPFANFTGDIYAFSFIFDLLDGANATALAVSSSKFMARLTDLAKIGHARCAALTMESIRAAAVHGSLQPAYDCLYYSYVYALLRYGYGISEDRQLHVAKKIRGYETAWTLGASLISLT